MIKLAPSLLSANFANLEKDIHDVETAGAEYLHLDVMDGSFVPNISFGVPVIKSIRSCSKMIFDVHLMINNPDKYFEAFASSGADIINFHYEASSNIKSSIEKIKSLHKKAAITIKPNTPIENIFEYVEMLDMVLIMSVEPGFGGQSLIPESLRKSEILANFIQNKNFKTEIQMDGGIYLENVKEVLSAGTNIIVSGSGVFGMADKQKAVKDFYKVFKEFEDSK